MTDRTPAWLGTREAARALGVSEASVRRWGDQGALPVRRVGKRGDRRFKAEQVETFVVPGRRVAAAGSAAPAVLVGGQPVAAGSHLVALYDSDRGRVRLTVPFLAEGLLAGQPCILFARGDELESFLSALRRYPRVDVGAAIASGLLVLGDAPGATVGEALDYWETVLWSALDKLAVVVRGVGEMASEREGFISEKEMLTYEALVNMTIKRFPCVVICQYDVRKFSGQVVLEALRAHPDVMSFPLGPLLK